MNAPHTPEALHELGAKGVQCAAFTVWAEDPDEIRRELDRFADIRAAM